MQIVLIILYAMLVLTGLVVAHEYGHYIMAKKMGIKVAEFSVGFGPRLLKWRRGETEFSFRPILFGGYVKFNDDLDPEAPPQEGDFRTAPLKARCLTAVAGPAMNVVVAFVLAVVMLMIAPEFQGVRVHEVTADSPAAAAGIEAGDVIKQMNGIDMDFYSSSIAEYQASVKGDTMELVLDRDGQRVETTVHFDPAAEEKVMGFTMETKPYNFFEACALSFKWLWERTVEIFEALGNLFFRGQGIENMSGIVGTTVIVGNVVSYGSLGLIFMVIALISINLAIVNMLPIPALDGGKLVLYGVEAIRKKQTPLMVEGIMNFAGMAAIMGLAVFLIFQDIGRLMGS